MLKKKFFIPLLLLVLILPAFYFFLKPGIYWNMHDDMQVIRQLEMEKCFQDGQIPCRWTPDLGYGYGYPLFNFYPPLPYYIGEIFRSFGASFIMTIKLVAAIQIILTAYFMYLLAKSLTNRLGGVLSAIFYTYAPYHAVNIYIRGAMNEAWASTFFPLVLYFIRRLVLKPKPINVIGLALSFSGILLTHNPMALIFSPICAVWAVICLLNNRQIKNPRIYIQLFISALLSISLTAYFTIPLLAEVKYVQVETMFSGYYNYSVHFATFFQLFFSQLWGDGPSVWGTGDQMSFMVGYLHWIVPLFIFIFSLFKYRQTKNKSFFIPVAIFILGIGYTFMAHERSTFIWKLFPPIQNVQFPWRFLNPVIFLMSLSVAYITKLFKNRLLPILLIISVILLNYKYFYPIHSGPITDQQKFSGESWRLLTTASIYDYLPKTASTAAKAAAAEYVDATDPKTVYTINHAQKGTDWLFLNINLQSDTTLTLPVLGFPGFKLYDFGQIQPYQIEPSLGRITTHLTSGDHQLYLKLTNTPIRTFSDYLSFFAWIVTLSLIIKTIWYKIPKFRK